MARARKAARLPRRRAMLAKHLESHPTKAQEVTHAQPYCHAERQRSI